MRNLTVAASIFFFLFVSTPAQALTYSPGGITEDTTWTKANGPYLVDTLFIPSGVTLTIESGTVVKLGQPGCNCHENIWVAGRIVAGALNSIDRVVFTSVNDDIGGDTNNDGTTTLPTSGDWRQIYITQGGTLELYNTDVRYGGSAYAPHIYFNGDNIRQINNVGGAVIMDGADLAYGYIANYRQWFNEGSTTIRNSHIHDSGTGLTFSSGSATIEGNTFSAIGRAIEYPWNNTTIIHRNNHGTGVITHSGLLESDAILTPDTLPYSDGFLIIPAGVTLTVMPGSIIKGLGALTVSGTLIMGTATATDDVIITSSLDDTMGGDTNGDGAATTPQAGDWGALIVTGSGRADITHTTLRYGGAYTCDYWGKVCTIPMLQNAGGTLTLSHAIATDAKEHILLSSDGTTTVTTSEFARGTYGVSVQRGTTTIHDSRIHDNSTHGVFNAPANPTMVDATNNWWGSPTGPTHPSNPGGTGDRISDRVTFTPWLGSEPATTTPTCTIDCNSNVLFLPGIEASRLYRPDYNGGTDQLWEPNTSSDVKDLYLDEDGQSLRDDIYTKDVIDEANTVFPRPNVYLSFLHDLKKWKEDDKIIADFGIAPYDWRLAMDDILNYGNQFSDGRIYYSGTFGATTTPFIIQELRRLAATSRTRKVTIIAHSNGGLVAKALINKLGADAGVLVDKIVFVAVPQLGTPQAVGAVLHGYDQGLPKDWLPTFLDPATARAFASTSPMAYHLLPSEAYFHSNGIDTITPIATFEDGAASQSFVNAYGHAIGNFGELQNFLLGTEGRPQPTFADVVSPSTLKTNLLTYAENLHQQLDDNWLPPESIKLYQIAGFGNDTVAGIKYWTGKECLPSDSGSTCITYTPALKYTPNKVVDGDGTVIMTSALAMSTSSPNASRWWVDLGDYNSFFSGGPSLPGLFRTTHANILEVPELRDFIQNNILTSSTTSLPQYVFSSTPPTSSDKRLLFFLHSPLDLSIRDNSGHEVSESTSTIPGAHFERFGEVQYISVIASSTPTLFLNGFAKGSFTLEIKEIEGNSTTASTTFTGIPSLATAKAIMYFPDGTLAHASNLAVDENNDGITDISLAPKLNDVVTLAHSFTGFLQPVNDVAYHHEQSASVFKGGSTIPVKFQLKNASGTPVQASTAPLWLAPVKLSALAVPIDEGTYVDVGMSGSTFKWDPASQQYIYNWSTKGLLAGYWYRIFAQLDDGTTQSVIVGIR